MAKNVQLKKKVGNTVHDINPASLASLIGVNSVTIDNVVYTDLQSLLTKILSDLALCSPANIAQIQSDISALQTTVGVHCDDTANPAVAATGLCADVEGIQASLNVATTNTTGANMLTKLNAINRSLTITSS